MTRLSIRSKLSMALLLTVVLTVGVTVWVAFRVLTAYSREEAERDLVTARQTIERFLDLRQEVALGHVRIFAARDDIREAITGGDRAALVRIGRRWMQEYGVDYVVVTDAAGVVLARAHAPGEYGDDARAISAVQAALRGIAVATIRRAPVVPLGASGVAPVFERASPYRLLGTAAVGFSLDGAFVAEMKRATGHDVSLIVDDARLYTTLAGRDKTAPAPAAGPTVVTIGDQSYRAMYGRLEGRYGGAVGRFEIAKSEASVLAAGSRATRAIATAGAVVAVVAVGAGLWFSARLSTPLTRLARAAEAMARGDRRQRVEIERGDEIGALGQAFDRMAVEVARAEEESRHLFLESERRRRAAIALSESARDINRTLDTRAVAQAIADRVRELMGAMNSAVYRLAPKSGDLVALAVSGPGPVFREGLVLAKGESSVSQLAVRERRPVWTPNMLTDPRFVVPPAWREGAEAARHRAVLSVPLIVHDNVIGTLVVADVEGRAFDREELDVADGFADQAAVALDNSRLYDEAERRRREAETLAGIARAIGATLDVDTILLKVAEGARQLARSDLARIALREPDSDTMVVRYWIGGARFTDPGPAVIKPGEGLRGRVLVSGRPARADNYPEDPRIGGSDRDRAWAGDTVAALVVPITIESRVEGVLYVINQSPRPFTDHDEAALTRLAEHAALAIRNVRLFGQTQSARQRLQALSRRLIEVQEAEHRQMARELHDGIGQALTAIKMNLEMLERRAEGVPARLRETVEIADQVLDQVRNLSLSLRPSVLDDLGLVAALRWHADRETRRAGLRLEFAADAVEPRPAPEIETACFRIAQEAITNIVRHADARCVSVGLQRVDGELELTVSDDGAGFDPRQARRRATGGGSMGLLSMEERATLLGGRLEVESEPGRGAVVRARLPLVGGRAS